MPRNRKALVPKRGGRNQGVQPTQSYEFNSVLGDSATQADVCQAVDIDSKVRAALDGFPVLLFAFGQTSAGKTHTVVGSLVVCLNERSLIDLLFALPHLICLSTRVWS